MNLKWIVPTFIVGVIGFGYGIVATIISGSNWFWLWLILGGLWLLIGLISCFEVHKRIKWNIPVLTTPAIVISKLSEQNVDGVGLLVSTDHHYFISFEFPDKTRKKFTVDAKQYALIREGDAGVLSYKQIDNKLQFIDFQLQA